MKPAETTTNESRRAFLQSQLATSAVVAAGCVVSGAVAHADDEPAQESKADRPVRLGLIGCGGRGTGAANDSLTINGKNVELVAMADLEQSNCERARSSLTKRHKDLVNVPDDKIFVGLDAYKKVLEDPNVDAVLLTTSPGFRPHHITDAVAAGKHVFAEKPTCVDPAGYQLCLKAHEAAEKQGTAIVTGTQYRRQTNYIAAIDQLRMGAIGDIISAESRYCSGGIWYKNRKDGESDLAYQLRNWMHFIWLSGDQIAEQAVHNIDAMNWVMGSAPVSAYGSGGRFNRPEDSEMWDAISIDYEYPGSRVISFKCRQWPGSTGDNGTTVYGSDGIMHIGAMSSGSRITDRQGKELWASKGSISDAYKQEHQDLVDSIIAGEPIVELKQTAESSLTAVMGRLAAYTGKRVSWDFVTKESKLDLFPKDLNNDTEIISPGHAVPGKTKLV